MKAHLLRRAQALLLVATVSMVSCIVPEYSDGRSSHSVGVRSSHHTSLPTNYVGDAYFYNGRYYSGGRYETGTFHDHGRTYDNRYYHSGQYYYGGRHEHHAGRERDQHEDRDHDRRNDFSDSRSQRSSRFHSGPSILMHP